MTRPVSIAFLQMPHDERLATAIRERARWLETFHDRIVECHVVVERPDGHHDGRQICVRLKIAIPGADIVVSHDPSLHGSLRQLGAEAHHKSTEIDHGYQQGQIAIHDAFDIARRQLQDAARRKRD